MAQRHRGRGARGQAGTGRQVASISPTNTDHLGAWEHPSADDLDGDSAPPERGGDYRGIGLLEPIWKVVEVLMDKRFLAIEFHDCLHGFLAGRGTGTATMEVKLAQQLAY